MNFPIPDDLPLPIPGNIPFFTFLLIVGFLLHIFFVSFLVAGSAGAVITQLIGLRTGDEKYDRLAQKLATLTSFNKSIAVVLGVAPLLLISVLYTSFFYPSSILIGGAWLNVIWLIILGFWALYAYKFLWQKLKERRVLHVSLGVIGSLFFLFIPLIFITNVQLMMTPERWLPTQDGGFFYALAYPHVWMKYAIFMLSAATISGVGLAFYATYKKKREPGEEKDYWDWVTLYGLKWAFYPIFGQAIALPIYMFNLSGRVREQFLGGTLLSTSSFIIAVIASLITAYYLYRGLTQKNLEKAVTYSVAFLLITSLAVGTVRQQIREHYVQPYKSQIKIQTGSTESPDIIYKINRERLRLFQMNTNDDKMIIQMKPNPIERPESIKLPEK